MVSRFRTEDLYMVRKVPASKWTVDLDHYEVINRKTGKRDWVGDVFATKETARTICAQMNHEVRYDQRAERRA